MAMITSSRAASHAASHASPRPAPGGEALMKSVVHHKGRGSEARSREGITWPQGIFH